MMRDMTEHPAPVHPGRIIHCVDHFVMDLRGEGRVGTYFTVYAVEYSPAMGTGHVAFLRIRGEQPGEDLDLTLTDSPEMARRMQARLRRLFTEVDFSRGIGTELDQEAIPARFERLPWTDEGVAWRIRPDDGASAPLIEARWHDGDEPFWLAGMEGAFTEGRDIAGMMAGFDGATLRIGDRIAPGAAYDDPWWESRLGRPFSACHVALAEASLTPAGSAWWGGLR